ncbi:uncharacterized protein METZ01_LOCUS325925, partial [marine metagenome]
QHLRKDSRHRRDLPAAISVQGHPALHGHGLRRFRSPADDLGQRLPSGQFKGRVQQRPELSSGAYALCQRGRLGVDLRQDRVVHLEVRL